MVPHAIANEGANSLRGCWRRIFSGPWTGAKGSSARSCWRPWNISGVGVARVHAQTRGGKFTFISINDKTAEQPHIWPGAIA